MKGILGIKSKKKITMKLRVIIHFEILVFLVSGIYLVDPQTILTMLLRNSLSIIKGRLNNCKGLQGTAYDER